jgi:lipopolysaccharide export system permease protein
MEYLGENGLDFRIYQDAFWEKILFPFTVIALVLAGMPFVFGPARSNNLGVRLFFGMILGGIYVIASKTTQNLGDVYDLPAQLTNLVPPTLLIVTAIMVLRRSV